MTEGGLVLAGMGLLLLAAWLADLWLHPFAKCWACSGRKTNPGSTPRRFGSCRWCGGSGQRRRIGAALVHRKGK